MAHHDKCKKTKLPQLNRRTKHYDKIYETNFYENGVSLRIPLDGTNIQNLHLVPLKY